MIKDSVELFGRKIPIRTHYCSFFENAPVEIEEPHVNLYVRTKFCNAKCKFCTFAEDAQPYNEKKYIEVLDEILKKVKIKKIAFTGGEPTLYWDKFKSMVSIAKEKSPDSLFTMNTDGLRLKQLFNDPIAKCLDYITLSRHHYDDKLNDEVFGFKGPSTDEIKEIQASTENKDLIHFACNLIKGYMDEKEKLYQYLEWVDSLDVRSVAFVSLMPVNDYSKERFIDFNIRELVNERFNVTKEWKYKDLCRCTNYVYLPESMNNMIKVYHKNTYNPFDIYENIIFDGENVKVGFTDDIIA